MFCKKFNFHFSLCQTGANFTIRGVTRTQVTGIIEWHRAVKSCRWCQSGSFNAVNGAFRWCQSGVGMVLADGALSHLLIKNTYKERSARCGLVGK